MENISPKKRKTMNGNGTDSSSSAYFEAYEDLDVHRLMLDDKSRTLAYKNAIFNMKEHFADKIVMDVGAGTGILTIFCAQAGAKKVYAVEASNLANIIPQVAAENNVVDKVQVIPKLAEDINPCEIEKVDIIVSEWMGFYLIHEGMLDSVIFSRDNFLKEGGLMFPSVAKIYAAPCQFPCYNELWNDVCGVSMKCVAELYRNSKSLKVLPQLIPKEDILADEKLLVWLDLNTTTIEELNRLGGQESVMICSKSGKYQGIGIWFDVEFPDGSILSTSPQADPTHWKQFVIVFPQTFEVEDKEPVAFTLEFCRSADPRKYQISFNMLDALELDHEIPCDCYMTKCIVTKAYIESQKLTMDIDTGTESMAC
ncbi:hypothetical protein QAD02_001743 [Eretmocerus hayati]|uniref:Uncharacterized protein n=1 Tax=Eretmocerus hayati TaxID=131215 RepID=A0ACC2NH91_9HYME|nr:hypothetical protein QAD02_001743 [Eretmocerus hayati]